MKASIAELGSGIYVVEALGGFAVNAGIIVGDESVCVVDTGCGAQELHPNLNASIFWFRCLLS